MFLSAPGGKILCHKAVSRGSWLSLQKESIFFLKKLVLFSNEQMMLSPMKEFTLF